MSWQIIAKNKIKFNYNKLVLGTNCVFWLNHWGFGIIKEIAQLRKLIFLFRTFGKAGRGDSFSLSKKSVGNWKTREIIEKFGKT